MRSSLGDISCRCIQAGSPRAGFEPQWKKLFRPPARVDRLQIFTLNRKDWLSVAEWLGLERVNLYNRQMMTLPRKIKTYNIAGPPYELPGPGNLYRLSPPLAGIADTFVWVQPKYMYSRQYPVTLLNTRFHEKLFNGSPSRYMRTDGQTDSESVISTSLPSIATRTANKN
jgi:hypothetical protein